MRNSLDPFLSTTEQLFQTGNWFTCGGEPFEVVSWNPENPFQVFGRARDSQNIRPFHIKDLYDPINEGKPGPFFAKTYKEIERLLSNPVRDILDPAGLPENLLVRADKVIQMVIDVREKLEELIRPYESKGEKPPLTLLTRQACKELEEEVCLSTYYKYDGLVRRFQGDRAVIAFSFHRKTYSTSTVPVLTQKFVDAVLSKYYRTDQHFNPNTIYQMATQLWEQNRHYWINVNDPTLTDDDSEIENSLLILSADENDHSVIDTLLANDKQRQKLKKIKKASRTWIYAYIKFKAGTPSDAQKAYVDRFGQAKWDENFLVFDHFARIAVRPLQYVFADHYLLDVFHVDDDRREVLRRLWLTELKDAHTRAPLGIHIGYKGPSLESILAALYHAIWPKYGLDQYGISLPWDPYGIAELLSLDNAWAHLSPALQKLIVMISGGLYTATTLHWRPPYRGRLGGLVERDFGDLSAYIREMLPNAGAILGPDKPSLYNANQTACYLYNDIVKIIFRRYVDYLHTPHRELGGMTPHEKWTEGMKGAKIYVPNRESLQYHFWQLYPSQRKVTEEGIGLFGLHYKSDILSHLRNASIQGKTVAFDIRVHEGNISEAAVFDNASFKGLVHPSDFRLPDGSYEPVSLWELEMTKKLVRANSSGTVPRSYLRHIIEARELAATRTEERDLYRRKLAQWQHGKPGRPRNLPVNDRLSPDQLAENEKMMAEFKSRNTDPRDQLFAS